MVLFVGLEGRGAVRLGVLEHGVEGVDEFGAGAVIQGHDELHAGVARR